MTGTPSSSARASGVPPRCSRTPRMPAPDRALDVVAQAVADHHGVRRRDVDELQAPR